MMPKNAAIANRCAGRMTPTPVNTAKIARTAYVRVVISAISELELPNFLDRFPKCWLHKLSLDFPRWGCVAALNQNPITPPFWILRVDKPLNLTELLLNLYRWLLAIDRSFLKGFNSGFNSQKVIVCKLFNIYFLQSQIDIWLFV